MVSDHSNKASLSANFRRKRMQGFAQLLNENSLSAVKMLDIGGTVNFWEMNLPFLEEGLVAQIDVVNLPPEDQSEITINGILLRSYQGNALDTGTLLESEYDVVHSNSVVEHVGNLAAQVIFAESVRSVGNYYWVQTPAKSFPLEPHFYVPFFAYLSLGLRAFLLRQSDLGFHKKEENWLQSRITCENTRLMTKREFQEIFPGGKILAEQVGFLAKSYIATNLESRDSKRKNL